MKYLGSNKRSNKIREHLYRGFHPDENSKTIITFEGIPYRGYWVEGCLLIDYITGQYFIHTNGNSVNESTKVNDEGCLRFFAFEVIPETVGEYTGLTDKNGKKGFEGDILISRMSSSKYTIAWEDCQFKIKDGYGNVYEPIQEFLTYIEIEVIGNIFENPELLSEGGTNQ